MDKLAQRRSTRSKIWENVNLTGKALEGLHSEFAEVMDRMRTTDEGIRNIAEDVKPLVRQAKSATRKRDYLGAAFAISEFHKRIRHVAFILGNFKKSVNIKHFDYLLDNFDTSNRDQLFTYNPNAELKEACQDFHSLVKEAGALDWLKDNVYVPIVDPTVDTISNIVTEKGRAGRLMEKRFSTKFIAQLKSETEKLTKESERMLGKLLKAFDKMESGVSRRNVNLYTSTADGLIKDFEAYHGSFVKYNDEVLGPLREYQNEINKKEQDARAAAQARKNQAAAEQKAAREKMLADLAEKERFEVEEARKSPFVSMPSRFHDVGEFKLDMQNKEDAAEQERRDIIKRYQDGQAQLDKLKKEKGTERMPFLPELESDVIDQVSQKEKKNVPVTPLRMRIAPEDMKDTHMDDAAYSKTMPGMEYLDEDSDDEESGKQAQLFINNLHKFASIEDASSFINEIIEYSENIDNSKPDESANLLAIANLIINDYKRAGLFDFLKKPNSESEQELQRRPERSKPQELIDRDNNYYKSKTIDIPDGAVDKSFDSIEALKHINSNNMKVTVFAEEHLKKLFVTRLLDVLDRDDLSAHANSIQSRFIPVLKKAVHDGWVVSSRGAHDSHNPKDKILEIYTRMDLSLIDNELDGTAKLTVIARLSVKNNTLTIGNIKSNFQLDNVHKNTVDDFSDDTIPDLQKYDQEEDYDSDLDDNRDQYDYPDEF